MSGQGAGSGQQDQGIGIVSFLTAVAVAVAIFAAQVSLFLLLRNKLARIFKPKTYLVPERERTDPPPHDPLGLIKTIINFKEREVINKCGLDAYFFLRYLRTMLIIFIPICAIVLPILVPINYVGGKGQSIDSSHNANSSASANTTQVVGLDTLSWGNIAPNHTKRYGAHLLMAILVIIWVCGVFFVELRVYIKVRQDYLTSAEHRLRASATTVLVNSIPQKWLSVDALTGLFDCFPGGVRNVWLNRDLSVLLDKIDLRDKIHKKLESAETDLIRNAKKAQLKKRDSQEKKQRKSMQLNPLSKKEKADRDAQDDVEAAKAAQGPGGLTAGHHDEVPHTVAQGMDEAHNDLHAGEQRPSDDVRDSKEQRRLRFPNEFTKAGHNVLGAFSKAGQGLEDTLGTTNGFVGLSTQTTHTGDSKHRRSNTLERASDVPPPSAVDTLDHAPSILSAHSTKPIRSSDSPPAVTGNTVRKLENAEDLYNRVDRKWWQFWKPPSGGYASPVPQGKVAADHIARKPTEKKTTWQTIKGIIPFMGDDEIEPIDYPDAYDAEYKEEDQGQAEWEKYLKKGDRPTHRLAPFGVMWLPGLPLINKKVDTIYWCRQELARLNVEIEEDQKHPERYPLMNSAFIQFNHQLAAHMVCQSVIHHVPKEMSPRMIEISPEDVVWTNMAVPWWQEWLRTAVITVMVCGMIFLWAIPVAWTAALSQLNNLVQNNSWLSFLTKNHVVETVAKAVAGVLPALVLSILLILVPIVLELLAGFKGVKTRSQKTEFVQIYYFVFLFIQVFLVVSIASFFAASLDQLVHNISELKSVKDVLNLLATNLPKAANYFFSYMILQAMSTSSGTLLQIGTLIMWYLVARMLDSTARDKWKRNTNLSSVSWGSFFPVYTNFACIGLVYCVIAPLISIFAVITFGLLWMAQRYAMIYVIRVRADTGGVLYPRAINQTFTGIYFMEICMVGLFFFVQDEKGTHTCTAHAIVMIVVLILTIIYQFLLNYIFSPLLRYLPVTFEDEAILRDEVFQRAQEARFGTVPEDLEGETEHSPEGRRDWSPRPEDDDDIELHKLDGAHDGGNMSHLINPVKKVTGWAKDGGNQLRKITLTDERAANYRRQQRRKDLEAQRAIGDALFGGFSDDIEDLTPDERDVLTKHAFQHAALRARRPTVWIPRDDLGISDDEVSRTQAYSEHIWISNEGTALDSKVRVVYGRNPPDFSELDIITL